MFSRNISIKILILSALLFSCGPETKHINSRYVSIDIKESQMTITNVSQDKVYVFTIFEEVLPSTIPPEITSRYIQKSFKLTTNNTKTFKFSNKVYVRYLRTCLIIKNKLDFCLSEKL